MAGNALKRGWTLRKVPGAWLTRPETIGELFRGLASQPSNASQFPLHFQPLKSSHVPAMFLLLSSYLFDSLLNSGVDRPLS